MNGKQKRHYGRKGDAFSFRWLLSAALDAAVSLRKERTAGEAGAPMAVDAAPDAAMAEEAPTDAAVPAPTDAATGALDEGVAIS